MKTPSHFIQGLLAITSCLVMSDAFAKASTQCPSQQFPRFLNAFESKVKVQKAFTAIPLKFGSYAPNYGDKPDVTYLKANEIDFPVLIDAKERKKQGVVLSINKKNTKWYQVSTHSTGTGAYTLELNFKKIAGCWRLVSMTDLST